MAKSADVIKKASMMLELEYDAGRNMCAGRFHDFMMTVYPVAVGVGSGTYYGATIYASKNDGPINGSELRFDAMPKTAHATVSGYSLKLTIGALGKADDIATRIYTAIASSVSALKAAGCTPQVPDGEMDLNARPGADATTLFGSGVEKIIDDPDAEENVISGLFGAVLGAAGGSVIMIILGLLGFVSIWAGLLLGIFTVVAYVKFAKNYSIKGVIVTSVVVVIATYLAFKTGDSLRVYKELKPVLDISFSDVFNNLKEIYKEADAIGTYYINLVLSLIAGIGGGIGATYMSTDLIKKKDR
ncbi:MAG: hypothetical protein K6F34_04835 [Lachnospiraceae bacterium]|nr:hypothetical protein [Lachnospiraceae bacterium]